MKVPNFLGGTSIAQSPIALNEQSMNWYPEYNPMPGATSKVQLYPTPGVTSFLASVYSPTRGGIYQNSRLFWAKGGQLVEQSAGAVETARGAIPYTTSQTVTFAANGDAGDQLMLISDGGVRVLDLNSNVMSTPAITGTPLMCAYLDGYGLYLDSLSALYKSALYDFSTWDATDVVFRSAAADPWVSVYVNKSDKLIWLFGEETSEAWYDAGTSPYPFKPVQGGLIPWGIAARFSVEQVGGSLIWLSQTSAGHADVVMLQGLTPQIISTPALTNALEAYDRIDDAVGDTYDDKGHRFYILTFPSAQHTWAYDLTTGQWAERGTWIVEDNTYIALRTLYHVFAFGTQLVGDRTTGDTYALSDTSGVDVDNRPIRRLRRGPAIFYENKRLFFNSFEPFLESGLGLTTGQGSNPMVSLRVSNNGGKTWSDELWRSAGAMGDYGRRVKWNRLGSGLNRQYEITVTDRIPWRLIDCFQEVQPGTEVAA